MKMKKAIICAILAGLLTTSAFAQEVNTSIDLDTRDVTVSGVFEESVFNRMISIEVTDKEDSTKIYYIGTFLPNADGSYNFKFRMPEEAETGYYNIKLGVYGKEETVKEIFFSTAEDINTFLNSINTAASISDVRKALEDSMNVLDIPKNWYDKLDSEGKDAVAKAVLEGKTYETLSQIKSIAYNEMAVQNFRCAENADEINGAMIYFADVYNINAETAKCFELYQKLGTTDTEIAQNQKKAQERMASADCDDIDGIIKAYDTSVLLTAINTTKSPALIKSYLDEDNYQSIYGFDMSTYEKSDKDKTAKYIYELNPEFKTMAELEKAISDAYKAQNTTSSGGGGGNNNNGGGGGGSKGGGITNYAPGTPVIPNNNENNENNADGFTDLAQAEWAREAIVYLADKNVVSGIAEEDGTFKFEPNSLVTREQFVKMLVQAFSLTDEDAECDFGDMQSGHWAYNAVASAFKKGIISGVSDSEFGTGKLITRQDMAVMAYKAAKAAGYELLNEAEVSFSDGDLISDYAKESVAAMNANGIINGYPDGRFAPTETATRAQAAQVIYTIIK